MNQAIQFNFFIDKLCTRQSFQLCVTTNFCWKRKRNTLSFHHLEAYFRFSTSFIPRHFPCSFLQATWNIFRVGPRFPSFTEPYDKQLILLMKQAGEDIGLSSYLKIGTYVMQSGPCYETPAEVRFLAMVGLRLFIHILGCLFYSHLIFNFYLLSYYDYRGINWELGFAFY